VRKTKEQAALKNFAMWLETLMVQNKLTAQQISKASGLHPNVISSWRKARCVPNGYSLALLASTLAYLTGKPRPEVLDSMVTAMLWD
jgi:transcriptional regulator with XRE-family HTH domain